MKGEIQFYGKTIKQTDTLNISPSRATSLQLKHQEFVLLCIWTLDFGLGSLVFFYGLRMTKGLPTGPFTIT